MIKNNDEIFMVESSIGDGLMVTYDDAFLDFKVWSDWSGCTETGFGSECSFAIAVGDAKKLYEFLGKFIHKIESEQ